jgi:hypothetical protein
MKNIALPAESTFKLNKDGSMTIEHTAVAVGQVGQALSEAYVEMLGGSVEELVRTVESGEMKETG